MKIKILASGSTGNSYIISDGETSLLLDAGIPVKQIQKGCNFKLSEIDGCLITHAHKDHSKAARDLMKLGVDVFASQGTIDACGLEGHRVYAVQGMVGFEIGTFFITPFDVQHDAPEPLGFLMSSAQTSERILYLTDSYYVKYRFDGLTHIMIECNYDAGILFDNIKSGTVPAALAPRIMKSHMSLDNLLEMLKANDLSRLQQIYLLHLSDNNSDARKFKETVQKLTGAEVYVC